MEAPYIYFRNQSFDLLFKPVDCFLYDRVLHHEKIKCYRSSIIKKLLKFIIYMHLTLLLINHMTDIHLLQTTHVKQHFVCKGKLYIVNSLLFFYWSLFIIFLSNISFSFPSVDSYLHSHRLCRVMY